MPEPAIVPDATPSPDPRPPAVAPLELARLRGSVSAGLFGGPVEAPRVGRYELLRCIGRGGMGIVYAARDVELGREVAIKLLRPELTTGDGDRLDTEARALARLSHPNVVSVFDVGSYEGQRFIAMEYVPGDDLRRWLQAPRPLRAVLRVFVDAGRGLHAAHAVGLVHRDFKPDNVLVGDDGRPRVLDFGLARPPDPIGPGEARPPQLPDGLDPLSTVLTRAGQVVGTPAYMAPEQYLGEPADARSDQFSFAVALYHAVYGVRPFHGDDPRALALSIVRGRVRPATPRYPVAPWLEQLLARALSVEPAQRFASMEALLSVIESHLAAGTAGPELDALPTRAFEEQLASASTGVLHSEGWDLDAVLPAVVVASPPVLAPTAGGMALAVPSADEGGVTTSLFTRRSLPMPLDASVLVILARELDRLEHTRGKVQHLGASMIWTTPSLEVQLDVTSETTEVLVWRRLHRSLRRRQARWMAAGLGLAAVFNAAVEGAMHGMSNDLVPIIVLGSLVGGLAMGFHKAQLRHTRVLPSVRTQVEFIADRLVGLARASRSPALPGADGR